MSHHHQQQQQQHQQQTGDRSGSAQPPQEKLSFYVQAEDGRKFKMVIRGDLGKLPVEKIKRYLKSYGVPDGQGLLSDGALLRDEMIGEDFGLEPGAVLRLISPTSREYAALVAASNASVSAAHLHASSRGDSPAAGSSPPQHQKHRSDNNSSNANTTTTSPQRRPSITTDPFASQRQHEQYRALEQQQRSSAAVSGGRSSSAQATTAGPNGNHNGGNGIYNDPYGTPSASGRGHDYDGLERERAARLQRMTNGGASMAFSDAPSAIAPSHGGQSSQNLSLASQYLASQHGSPSKPPGIALHPPNHQHSGASGGSSGSAGPVGVRVQQLEADNDRLRREVEQLRAEVQRKRQSSPPSDDMYACARANLSMLGQDLGTHLAFDQNLTCAIGNDERNTILVTFDAATERLYLYSTILTALPQSETVRMKLYECLLDGAMLGRDMAGGGVGVSLQNNVVMLCTSLSLRNSTAHALRDITPAFLEALRRWRAVASDVCAGHLH